MSVCLSVSLVVHILGSCLSLPLSLRPNGGCQTIELELCPRVSLLANTSLTSCHQKTACKNLANTSLTSCHRKTARELQKSCSTEHWGEKISGGAAIWSAPPVQQTLHYNHQTWSPVETLGPKWELAKFYGIQTTALPDIQTAAITKLQTPKLYSESIDWRTWPVAQSERQSTPVEPRQWTGGQKVNENYWGDQKRRAVATM